MEEAIAADVVPNLLREYGDLTRVELCRYLGPREPRRHLYNLVADYPRRGGRMLRPTLCIAAARAFGAEAGAAVRSAAALELLHNAFLVHDDVEDESDERRGRPTMNALHGTAIAVNVGDALTLLGLRALLDNRDTLGPRLAFAVLEEAERMARESVEGQAIELGWRSDNALHISDDDYLVMVLKKTCWYTTIFPLRAGALIAGARGVDPEQLLRFGFFLGAAFQIRDDLLNLEGDAVRYGKEIGGDIWEGKRTLMLVHLLRNATASEHDRLSGFLAKSRAQRLPEDVAWVRRRMDEHGCLDHARQVAHALAGAARHEFDVAFRGVPESPDREFVHALCTWVLSRG